MARPGLEPGTPRFSVVTSKLRVGAKSLDTAQFQQNRAAPRSSEFADFSRRSWEWRAVQAHLNRDFDNAPSRGRRRCRNPTDAEARRPQMDTTASRLYERRLVVIHEGPVGVKGRWSWFLRGGGRSALTAVAAGGWVLQSSIRPRWAGQSVLRGSGAQSSGRPSCG
jgi:hypothetical protein